MKFQFCTVALLILGLSSAGAQVASHAPTAMKAGLATDVAGNQAVPTITAKPVARVNGVVLTEQDLAREIVALFPYAQVHSGIPKDLEPELRKGALEMIIFEELLFQQAKRRHLTVSPARLARAEADFRKQFPSKSEYERYLNVETNGSRPAMREKIRRSLLIETMLDTEVRAKAKVSVGEARAHYAKNSKQYEHGEIFHVQSISIMPPRGADREVLKEARRRAEEALKDAKATKNYREFGLLAERVSDDDFHVKLGDHRPKTRQELPPEIVKAASALKPGQVSDLIQLGNDFTIIRLIAHTPAGRTPFVEVKTKLQSDLEKEKTERIRAALGEKLRKNATIERM